MERNYVVSITSEYRKIKINATNEGSKCSCIIGGKLTDTHIIAK